MLAQPKRAPSSYMLWLKENRPRLVEELGTTNVADVAKAAGKQWGALGAKQKAKYEEEAHQLRADYKLELQKFVESGGVLQKRTSPKSVGAKPSTKTQEHVSRKSINKAKKNPNVPKRPASAYILWLND